MIWWPFITEHEFIMQCGEKKLHDLTKGFSIENAGVDLRNRMKINILVGNNRYQITHAWDAAIVKIVREKEVIKVSINNEWSQTYYLKTPWVWKSK